MSAGLQEYILRCGQLYLGPKNASRVGNPDRAVRFSAKEAAEACAAELRGSGVFQLPWEVVSVPISADAERAQ